MPAKMLLHRLKLHNFVIKFNRHAHLKRANVSYAHHNSAIFWCVTGFYLLW